MRTALHQAVLDFRHGKVRWIDIVAAINAYTLAVRAASAPPERTDNVAAPDSLGTYDVPELARDLGKPLRAAGGPPASPEPTRNDADPSPTDERAWADRAAQARASWARENPFGPPASPAAGDADNPTHTAHRLAEAGEIELARALIAMKYDRPSEDAVMAAIALCPDSVPDYATMEEALMAAYAIDFKNLHVGHAALRAGSPAQEDGR